MTIVLWIIVLHLPERRSPAEFRGRHFWQETDDTLLITLETNKKPKDYSIMRVSVWNDSFSFDFYGEECSTSYDERYLYISLDVKDLNFDKYFDEQSKYYRGPYRVEVLMGRPWEVYWPQAGY